MVAKEYLREARRCILGWQHSIQFKKDSIAQMYAIMTNSAAPDYGAVRVQSGGNFDRFPNILGHIQETESEIDTLAANIIEKQLCIAPYIDTLPKYEQRHIMHLYYIHAKPWEDVIKASGYSDRHVYRIHGEALRIINKKMSVTCQ